MQYWVAAAVFVAFGIVSSLLRLSGLSSDWVQVAFVAAAVSSASYAWRWVDRRFPATVSQNAVSFALVLLRENQTSRAFACGLELAAPLIAAGMFVAVVGVATQRPEGTECLSNVTWVTI